MAQDGCTQAEIDAFKEDRRIRAAPSKGSARKKSQKLEAHLRNRAAVPKSRTHPLGAHYHSHAPRLQSAAKKLEKSMMMDSLSKKIRARPNPERLRKRNIMEDAVVAPSQARVAAQLEKAMAKDSLHFELRVRPDKETLYKYGVLNPDHKNLAASLAGVSTQLDRNMKKSRLSRNLEMRATPKSLKNSGYFHASHGSIATSLEAPTRKLESAFKRDALNRGLQSRPDIDALYAKGILDPDYANMDRSLVNNARHLEDSFKKDYLSAQLRNRVPLSLLHDEGIVDRRVVSHGGARSVSEKLEDYLKNRMTPQKLADNIVPVRRFVTDIDPSLAATSRRLERKLQSDMLSRQLHRRKTEAELRKCGILTADDGTVDGSLLPKKKALETAFKKDALSRHLRHRPSPNEIELYRKVPDFLNEEYVSPLKPRKEGEAMNLEYAIDEVRHCLHNIGRFKRWLDYME
eukprot:g2045.t1